MARKQLYINGTGTGDFGIYISSDTYLNAPAPDITAHAVPARNGDLIMYNRRLNNIVRRFTCYIPTDVQANFDGFKKLLYSNANDYMELASDYESDTYQRGYLADEIEAEPFLTGESLAATFDLYFSCEPQKYYKTNEASSGAITSNMEDGKCSYIFPRNHPFIQKFIDEVSIADKPTLDNEELFGVIQISSEYLYSYPNDRYWYAVPHARTASRWPAAVAIVENITDLETINFLELLQYKPDGQITLGGGNEGYVSGRTSLQSIAFITPLGGGDGVINAQSKITKNLAQQTQEITIEDSTFDISCQATISSQTALGVSFDATITGNMPAEVSGDVTEKVFYFALIGRFNNITRFSTLVTIDVDRLKTIYPYNIKNDMEIILNSTLNSVSWTWLNVLRGAADFAAVEGEADNIADELKLYVYQRSEVSGHGFFATAYTIAPTWWKV